MKGKTWIAWLLTLCLLAMSGAALADAQWAEENGLNKTETVEELYQAALAEGGVLNLYGCTGRDETVGKSFEEAYPGITVNFYDLGINEMLEKFTREYEAGIYTADVLCEVRGADTPEARAALLAQLYENAQHLLNRKPTCWQRIGA